MLKTIGNRVKELRLQREMRPESLALLIKVGPSTLWKMESGFFEFKYSHIIKIAAALESSVEYILCGDAENIKSTEEIENLKLKVEECQSKMTILKNQIKIISKSDIPKNSLKV